jgi:hemolysin activation/secretion protein
VSFLQLTPASRRLRLAARAHAAGELSQIDYRQLRQQIIAELAIEFGAPRSSDRTTDQNGLRVVLQPAGSVDVDLTQRRGQVVTEQPVAQPSARRRAPLIFMFALVTLLLFGSAIALAVPVIAPVRDRDPNPQNSPVFDVAALSLRNYTPLPGLDRETVDGYLALWLQEARSAAQPSAVHGFSTAELDEVGRLLARLGAHAQTGLVDSTLPALNALVRRQRVRRGVTLVQMEQIAQRLQVLFRERGWLVARAFVPAQTPVNAVVEIEVLPGRLAAVELVEAAPLGELARTSLRPLIDRPLRRRDLESVLYRLNALPGVQAQGSLSAGAEVGETTLSLQLQQPRRAVTTLVLNNYGDEATARYRAGARVEVFNPLGRGDLLSLGLTQRFDPHGGTLGELNYRLPMWRLGDSFELGVAGNRFTAERGLGGFEGRTRTLQLGLRRELIGRREHSLHAELGAVLQNLELAEFDQRLWWFRPRIGGHWVLDERRWVLRGELGFDLGQFSSGEFDGQSRKFLRTQLALSAWRPLGAQSLRLEIAGQLGNEDLPDSLKQSLGGAQAIRGLRPGAFASDNAISVGVDLTLTPRAWRASGELGVFSRWAYGESVLATLPRNARVWEVGARWRAHIGRRFWGELSLASPVTTHGLENDNDSARLLFTLSLRP